MKNIFSSIYLRGFVFGFVILFAIVSWLFIVPGVALADDTGFLVPSANKINAAPSWANSQNGYASDDAYATTTNTNSWVSYGDFNVPAFPTGSTIDGIEVSAEGKTAGRDIDISLSWNDRNYTSVIAAGFATTTDDVVKLIGGATDTWGRTWSTENFTNDNFKVRATAHTFSPNGTMFSLDQIQVKVYYTKKNLTPNITADSKIYDGNNTAEIATCSLTGVVSPDVVTCSASGAVFDDKNVGTDKIVTATGITLGGADAGNYTCDPSSASTTASITKRNLIVTAVGVNKVYDGNTTATTTLSDDRISGDFLDLSYASAEFADPNAATGIAISVAGISISGGADAGNYTLVNTTASTTADINQIVDNTTPVITPTAEPSPPPRGGNGPLWGVILGSNPTPVVSAPVPVPAPVPNPAPAPAPVPIPIPKSEVKTIVSAPKPVKISVATEPEISTAIEIAINQATTTISPESQIAAAAAAINTSDSAWLRTLAVAAFLIVLIGGLYKVLTS